MNNSMIKPLIAFFALLCLAAPAFGVSYPAPFYHSRDGGESCVRGDAVYLFHSGTDDVKKTLRVGDSLPVCRISRACEVREAGRIRVVSYVGENYIRAEVVEGEIAADDIARKGKVSCLVISAGICEK